MKRKMEGNKKDMRENRFFKTSDSGKQLEHHETFFISGLAAFSSHLIHHPLYGHMMKYGKDFNWYKFGQNIRQGPLRFSYRGKPAVSQ